MIQSFLSSLCMLPYVAIIVMFLSGNVVADASSCYNNLTISLASFETLSATQLGEAVCQAIGDECIGVEYIRTTTSIATILEGSVIPGVKTPTQTQKALPSYDYLVNAVNRTVALTALVNSARYASLLTPFKLQNIRVINVTVYDRYPDPIFSYIGNTAQCLKHFWYLVFFIAAAPILTYGGQYFYNIGKEEGRQRNELIREQAKNFHGMNPSVFGVSGVSSTPPLTTEQAFIPAPATPTPMLLQGSGTGGSATPTPMFQPPQFSPQSMATPQVA